MKKYLTLHSAYKLAISIGLAGVILIISLNHPIEQITRIVMAWDVFSLSYLVLSWITISWATPKAIRLVASKEDVSSYVIFSIVLVVVIGSLYGVLVVLRVKDQLISEKALDTFIYLLGVFCSWILLHTLYTFRYAHIYYGDHPTAAGTHAGGLAIPGNEEPDYLDFAYFSFVLGMTYQVSDINITTKILRRQVLFHSLLSFVFNAIILALTVNEILGL